VNAGRLHGRRPVLKSDRAAGMQFSGRKVGSPNLPSDERLGGGYESNDILLAFVSKRREQVSKNRNRSRTSEIRRQKRVVAYSP
jgi:hypothetical protein